ncbi:MAG TPA: efflux RND transporter permease subunit [Bryobacteraceae bacterium]|nr:efflux RND transporter permease subunit [Bryobacteraceae bacterium]
MNFSEGFIRRPIATSLLMAAIALFGVVAYRSLPVSDMPNVDMPVIQVQANLPGADPQTMASSVATVLERQFTTIAGVDQMKSGSSAGNTQIQLQFDINRDIDGASVDVQTAIAEALPLLPPGMPSPPSFKKNNPNSDPIVQLYMTSPTLSLWELDDYAENTIAPRIAMMSGVSQVQVQGAAKYAVRVQLDPDKLVAKKIGINEVANAIGAWNSNSPTGTLNGPRQAYNVKTNGELSNAKEFGQIAVAWRNGSPIRLNEVANVIDSVENELNASWVYSGGNVSRAIRLEVQKQPGANTIEVADRVKALLPSFEKQLPESVTMGLRGDRSRTIREAFIDMQRTMAITLLLVVVVIFLFLRSGRATIIPALALPFSLLGTLAVMALLGYSLNTLSMMALILSVCFVVDDAIVMLENVVRHIEQGMSPRAAALVGSKEIGFTILSMTLSLAAVFIPLLFMSGILGRMLREFAVTICAAILVSGVVSITLTPMLASKLLRGKSEEQKHGHVYWALERVFQGMFRFYEWSLGGVLKHRTVMGMLFLATLAGTYYLYTKVPTGLAPEGNDDFLYVNMETAQGTSFYKLVEYQRTVAEVVRQEPNIETFMTQVGGGNNGRQSNFQVLLKPRRQRTLTASQIAQRLRAKMQNFPGVRVNVNVQPSLRLPGINNQWGSQRANYEFALQGPDIDELYVQAAKMEDAILTVPEVQDVGTDLAFRSPRINIEVDRERAALYGLNPNDIQNALYGAYGPRIASTIYSPKAQYRVVMEVEPKYQAFADYLSKIYFKTNTGALVPLDSLARTKEDVGPQSINHVGQLPSVTVSFNLKPGISLGDVVGKLDDLARKTLPGTITAKFSGNAQAFQDSVKDMGVLFLVAILVVYIVLGVLYESYIHPLTILSGLPSACLGALLTLYFTHSELNMYSFVGMIMLAGIVKKNAIMQVDFALAEERLGATPLEAIYRGCLIRFRPIMMTTAAAILGSLPVALGWGSGGETRRPIGLTVLGGILVSQIMTLYLTPVVYTYMAGLSRRVSSRPRMVPVQTAPSYGD